MELCPLFEVFYVWPAVVNVKKCADRTTFLDRVENVRLEMNSYSEMDQTIEDFNLQQILSEGITLASISKVSKSFLQ